VFGEEAEGHTTHSQTFIITKGAVSASTHPHHKKRQKTGQTDKKILIGVHTGQLTKVTISDCCLFSAYCSQMETLVMGEGGATGRFLLVEFSTQLVEDEQHNMVATHHSYHASKIECPFQPHLPTLT
jgi:hypothetical protein